MPAPDDPSQFEYLVHVDGDGLTVPDVGGYEALVHVDGSGLEVPADGNYEVVVMDLGPCDCCGACVSSDCTVTCSACTLDGFDVPLPCDFTYTASSPDCSIFNFSLTVRDVDPLTKDWTPTTTPPYTIGGVGVQCDDSLGWLIATMSYLCSPSGGGAQLNWTDSFPTVVSCNPLELTMHGGVITTTGVTDCACVVGSGPTTVDVTVTVTAPALNWCLRIDVGDGGTSYVCSDDPSWTHVGQSVSFGGTVETVVNGPFYDTPCDPNCPCVGPMEAPMPTLEDVTKMRVEKAVRAFQKGVGKRPDPKDAPRPIRCEHLGRRTEMRAGCNGWLCRHECAKGLPATPGLYCQVKCRDYQPHYTPEPGEQVRNDWLD